MNKKIFFSLLCILFLFNSCEEKKYEDEPSTIQKINTLGIFSIKTEDDKIILAPKHQKITAPLLYNEDFSKFNFNGFYRILSNNKKVGYFRFGWIEYKDSTTILSNVNWFYKKPLITNNFEDFTIETIEVPSIQKGNLKICTIGDSQTWWSASAKLRKEMDKLNPDFYFTGSNVDIFEFPHEAEGGNSTASVLKRIKHIPEADFYTLLIGTNDWKENIAESTENIKAIVNFLLEKYPSSKIIYLSPLPTTNKGRDIFNKNLQLNVEEFISTKSSVLEIRLGEKMRENENWAKEYFKPDGLHPNEEGVKFMAEQITLFINQQTD